MKLVIKYKLENIIFLTFFVFINIFLLKDLFKTHQTYQEFTIYLITILIFICIIFIIKRNFKIKFFKSNYNILYFFFSIFFYFLILYFINYEKNNITSFYWLAFKFLSIIIVIFCINLNFKEKFFLLYINLLFYLTLFSLFYYFLAITNIINFKYGFIVYDSVRTLRLGSLCGEPSVYSFLLTIGIILTIEKRNYFKCFFFIIAGALTYSNLFIIFMIITTLFKFKKYLLFILPIVLIIGYYFFFKDLSFGRFSYGHLFVRLNHIIELILNSNLYLGNGLYSLFNVEGAWISGGGIGKLIHDLGVFPFILILFIAFITLIKIDSDFNRLLFIICMLNILLQDTYSSIFQYTFLIYALQKN